VKPARERRPPRDPYCKVCWHLRSQHVDTGCHACGCKRCGYALRAVKKRRTAAAMLQTTFGFPGAA
jgi:hypothetical protein